MYMYLNLNPNKLNIHDCVIRAISLITGVDWHDVFLRLSMIAYDLGMMPDSDKVWQTYLLSNGFIKYKVSKDCPDCITVREFSEMYPNGRYIVASNGHMVAVIDGHYYDTFDTGDYIANTIWMKGRYTNNE